MKKLLIALTAALTLTACSQKNNVLTVGIPPRPAGQEDAILMTSDPMDTVRIGIVGIGMRGRGAVGRFARIPGAKVVALCDIDSASVARGQKRLARYGCPPAAEYIGPDKWQDMCRRDDLDLIYIVTDWKTHAQMGVYAMEHGKHVAVVPDRGGKN